MRISLFMSVLSLLLMPVSAEAVLIPFADLDFGTDTQRVEPGYVGIDTAITTGITAATGDMFDLTIDDSVGSFGFRDRGDGPAGSLIQVAEDMVKSGSSLTFTFSGLPAGDYTVTGYFRDASLVQFNNIVVDITDANGASNPGVVGDASQVPFGAGALTTAIVEATSIMDFTFVSDGSDVILSFSAPNSNSTGIELPVSGLSIQFDVIPEPTSIALALLGLTFGCTRIRRKK